MTQLQFLEQDCTLIAQYVGELTLETAGACKKQLEEEIAKRTFESLILDMEKISFIDSSGIGMLVSLNSRIKGYGKSLFLLSPAEQVKKTLELVQLTEFFHILDEDDDALVLGSK